LKLRKTRKPWYKVTLENNNKHTMKKIKQYGITMPIEMHERLNKMKKDT